MNRLEKRLNLMLASLSRTLLQLWSTFLIIPVTPWQMDPTVSHRDLDHNDHVHHKNLADIRQMHRQVTLRLLTGLLLMSPDAFEHHVRVERRNCGAYSDADTYNGGTHEPAPCTRSSTQRGSRHRHCA